MDSIFALAVIKDSAGKASSFEAQARFETAEEAQAFAASLPKKLKPAVSHCFAVGGGILYHSVNINARLRSTKNNQANETGIARLELLLASATVEMDLMRGNCETLSDALSAIYSEVK